MTGAHHSVGQAWAIYVCLIKASAFFQIGVELLEVILRELIQFDMTKCRQNMQSDSPLVTVSCAFPNAWFAVVIVPELQPVAKGHFRIDGIGAQLTLFLHGLLEFLFALSLGPGEDALRNGIAVLLVADHIASFECTVRLFNHTARSACSSLLAQGFSPFPKMFDMKFSVTTAACFCMSLVTCA